MAGCCPFRNKPSIYYSSLSKQYRCKRENSSGCLPPPKEKASAGCAIRCRSGHPAPPASYTTSVPFPFWFASEGWTQRNIEKGPQSVQLSPEGAYFGCSVVRVWLRWAELVGTPWAGDLLPDKMAGLFQTKMRAKPPYTLLFDSHYFGASSMRWVQKAFWTKLAAFRLSQFLLSKQRGQDCGLVSHRVWAWDPGLPGP